MAREVTLVDAGLGNLASVERALIQVGAGVRVTDDPDKVATSRMVVFPGQSAFGAATQAVVDGAMGAALRMVIERGDPFLGICLGMQLLFDGSDENGGQEGLHVLPGRCRSFPYGLLEEAEPGAIERRMDPAAAKPEHVPAPQSMADDDRDDRDRGGSDHDDGLPAGFPEVATSSFEASVVPPPPEWSGPTVEEVGHGTTITTDELPEVPLVQAPAPVVVVAAPAPAIAQRVEEVPPIEEGERPPLMRRVKVPHMGWNEVEPTGDHYYFVHSFYVEPARMEDVMWMSRYGGIRFPAAVRRGNVMGCQFHPEKSQRAGLRFLRAFLLGGWG
jgi:imidazoleglycerol phosphate synthase glutamine amidotransferase subunit HisH